MPRIHIAILDADVPVPSVYAARGLYSSQFRALLQSAAARVNNNNNPSSSSHNTGVSDHMIEIQTSAYDIVGGSFPALNALRKNSSQKTMHNNNNAYAYAYEDTPIDAILVTGSLASAYELEKYGWITHLQNFIQTVWTHYPAVKLFGSCFGHQIIAQALLSRHNPDINNNNNNDNNINININNIIRNKCQENIVLDEKIATVAESADVEVDVQPCPTGYEIGIHPIRLNPAFVDSVPGKALSVLKDGELRIQLFHGDRVVSSSSSSSSANIPGVALPKPWMNIGSTRSSPIQGLYYPGRVLTYQGHFEFDAFVNRELLAYCAERAGWAEEAVEKYVAQIGGNNNNNNDDDDSKLAAEVVVRFLAGDGDDSTSATTTTTRGWRGSIRRFVRGVLKLSCVKP